MLRTITILCCLFSFVCEAQFKMDTSKRVNYLVIPALFKTPETGWAYGVSSSANFKTSFKDDSLTRISTITALGIFSQKEQNIQAIDATIYFPKEKHILYTQISHSYFPDNFWGIGTHTSHTNIERYAFEQLIVTPHIKRKILNHLFLGLLADYQNILKIQYIKGGVMDQTSFDGKFNYTIIGLGLTASYDTRNSTFWPTKGFFAQTQYTHYNKSITSDYNFNKWTAEVRLFKKTFKKQIIATQLYHYLSIGETPFRSMASLGGAGNLRGFYQGRFRDKSMYSVILEYRAYLFWRISACVFTGIGDVYDHPKNLNTSTIKKSIGGGLRLCILEKENLNLRFDYGYSDVYNKGFYFTIGECF